MKKHHLLPIILIVFTVFCTSLSAQGIRFGLKAGAGMAKLNFSSEPIPDEGGQVWYAGLLHDRNNDFKPTFLLGGVLEFDLTKDFLLSTGLHFSPRFSHVNFTNGNLQEFDFKLRLLYMQVPLNVHYRTGGFFLGAGAYLGMCTSGKWELTETSYDGSSPIVRESGEKVIFGEDPEFHNLRRLDFGIRGEVGYGFKTIRLSLAYDHGLANNLPGSNDDATLRHQAFFVTATYYWLLKE